LAECAVFRFQQAMRLPPFERYVIRPPVGAVPLPNSLRRRAFSSLSPWRSVVFCPGLFPSSPAFSFFDFVFREICEVGFELEGEGVASGFFSSAIPTTASISVFFASIFLAFRFLLLTISCVRELFPPCQFID